MASFSEDLHRIPTKERTAKAVIALTLFSLGATSEQSAVDSNAVTRQLKLSLPKNVRPTNVALALRRAEPWTTCASAESGLLWHVSATGLNGLSAFGITASPAESVRRIGYDFDVAIVCALHRPELSSVFSAFGGEAAWQALPEEGHTHIYKTISVASSSGAPIRIVAGAPTYMGLTASAIIATQMLFLFKPRLIMNVGVAAGTKSKDRCFGDILVADPSVDYASGKISFAKGQESFEPDPFPLPINASLRTMIQEHKRTRSGLDDISQRWPKEKPHSELNLHIGPLGAADQVVDSKARVKAVKRNWRKLIGIEMETYAVYRASHEAPQPRPQHVCFKSVCDFAQAKKDDFQDYAAFTAASFAKFFLVSNWDQLESRVLQGR